MGRPFTKMHGLGNDFVVVDAREIPFRPGIEQARHIADRRVGIGCDQLIVLEPSTSTDVFMRIYNADGTEAEACGNATRCIASRIIDETGLAARLGAAARERAADFSLAEMVDRHVTLFEELIDKHPETKS